MVLLSPTSEKISTQKNLARVAADEQNGPGVRESPEKKRFFLVLQFFEGLEEHHRIQDLNEIQYGIRENAIFLDWIRDVTATRQAGFAKVLPQGVVLGKETGDDRSSGCELVV